MHVAMAYVCQCVVCAALQLCTFFTFFVTANKCSLLLLIDVTHLDDTELPAESSGRTGGAELLVLYVSIASS